MSTPGFTAEDSLYKTSGQYHTSAALVQAGGAILQEFSSPEGRWFSPTPLAGSFPGPGGISCGTCYLDDTGACVKDCVSCRPGPPPVDCQNFTAACPDRECCPPGQDPCPDARFCCPPGQQCCDSKRRLCCPASETCCVGFGANACCSPG